MHGDWHTLWHVLLARVLFLVLAGTGFRTGRIPVLTGIRRDAKPATFFVVQALLCLMSALMLAWCIGVVMFAP